MDQPCVNLEKNTTWCLCSIQFSSINTEIVFSKLLALAPQKEDMPLDQNAQYVALVIVIKQLFFSPRIFKNVTIPPCQSEVLLWQTLAFRMMADGSRPLTSGSSGGLCGHLLDRRATWVPARLWGPSSARTHPVQFPPEPSCWLKQQQRDFSLRQR